jgi:hypothetical protein
VQWVSDPRTCVASGGADCDTGFSLGALIILIVTYWPFLAGAAIGKAISRNEWSRSSRTSMPPAFFETSWAPIAIHAWSFFRAQFRSAPAVLQALMLVVVAWAACFYALLGPLIFDAVYSLLCRVRPLRDRRTITVGLSLAAVVTYLVVFGLRSILS